MIPPKPLHLNPSDMLGAVTPCDADRDDILDLLVAHPECISDDLQLVDRDVDLGGDRRLDLLGKDGAGQPVVILVRGHASEDSFFLRMLDIPLWLADTRPLLDRLFAEQSMHFDAPARVVVVGDRFSTKMLARAERLQGNDVRLVKVQCLKAQGKLGLLTETLVSPAVPGEGALPFPGESAEEDDEGFPTSAVFEEPSAPPPPPAAPPPELPPSRLPYGAVEEAASDFEPDTPAEPDPQPEPEPEPEPEPVTPTAPPEKDSDPLDELLEDGLARITALSDRIESSRLADAVRFLLDGRILAEIRRRPDALEIVTDPATSTGPIRNATDFEDGLNRIITKFFRLEEKDAKPDDSGSGEASPQGNNGSENAPPEGEGENLDLFRPATLTEDEIAELYAEDANAKQEKTGSEGT